MMIQPMDTLSQLALCCGFGNRRREYKAQRNFFYSPSTALLDSGNSWPLANHYAQPQPQPQPYFLLTQPVIIANNPSANPMNTITLVQHAQSGIPSGANFPALSILAGSSEHHQQQQQPHPHLHQGVQSNIISSQYAVYNSSTPLNSNRMSTQATTIYEPTSNNNLIRNQSAYFVNKSMLPIMGAPLDQLSEQRPVTLSSDIFRQLEVIEKQIDLSREIELVERHGIVTTRTIDPFSLMSETLLRKYHERFLYNEESIIKFVEIIKRPGQTLGLYIRSIRFEDPRTRGTRAGLIVTKIDTDSPIYNNQVLHVGDEILSVNLIDIQGMNLDDVVILMSIPKRLVLALRVPRERDRLQNSTLLQSQDSSTKNQMLVDQHEHSLSNYRQQQAIQDLIGENQYQRQTSAQNGMRLVQNREPLPSTFNEIQDNFNDARLRRGLNQEEGIYAARPVRVHSAALVDEIQSHDMYPESRNQSFAMDDFSISSRDQPRRYSGDFNHWSIPGYRRNTGRPVNTNQDHQRFTNRFDQQAATFKPREEVHVDGNEFQEFDIAPRAETFEENAKSRSPALERCQVAYSTERGASTTPLTLPRRTLPTRPDTLSSPTTSIKQPVISNLRLSDTPEQSSYFSSSIDAINRELKELRRQRMALSDNEGAVESSQADF